MQRPGALACNDDTQTPLAETLGHVTSSGATSRVVTPVHSVQYISTNLFDLLIISNPQWASGGSSTFWFQWKPFRLRINSGRPRAQRVKLQGLWRGIDWLHGRCHSWGLAVTGLILAVNGQGLDNFLTYPRCLLQNSLMVRCVECVEAPDRKSSLSFNAGLTQVGKCVTTFVGDTSPK